MTQVTRLGGVIPILNKGAIGYDPGEVADSEDTPDPVDVAADGTGAVAEVPFIVGGSVALVQSKVASSANSTTLLTATYDATPTQGNLLTITMELRDELASAYTTPAGWTLVDAVNTGLSTNDSCAMWYRVAGASESATVTVSESPANAKRMVIAEWSGVQVLDASTSLANQAGATTHSIGPITPTAGDAALVLALFVKNVGDGNPHAFSPGSGYTTLDEGNANVNIHPRYEVEYKLVGTTSGSYTADATQSDSDKWAAILAIFMPPPSDVLWNLAPETVDENDATYDEVAAATSVDSIWRIQLANPAKVAHVVAKIGANPSGAQSTDLYGATLPDFSDETLIATRAWTATGSYTSDTIDLLTPGTTAYQYYRLTGPDDVRIYTVNMFAPVAVTTADLSGYQQTGEKDQPNGYAGLDSGGLVPVAELPDIEDLHTGSNDTTKVYAPDGAGGVTLVAMAAGVLPWFNVVNYGAVGDGSTNDLTAINAAVADFNVNGGVLYFPAATGYYVSAGINALTQPGLVLGDGLGQATTAVSPVKTDSATAALFTVSANFVEFRGLGLACTATTPSAGAAIVSTTGHGSICTYRDLWINGFYDGLNLRYGSRGTIDNVHIVDVSRYGLWHANIDSPDGGDWSLSNIDITTSSAATHTPTSAIRQDSAGGVKVVNLKINGDSSHRFVTGYDLNINGSANDTSILTLTGSSIENVSGDAILISTTGTGSFGLIAISAVQFGLYSNNAGRCVKISAASTGGKTASGGIGIVTLDGLVAYTDGTARAMIELVNTDRVTLGDLAYQGFNARYTSSGDTNTIDSSTPSFATPAIVLGSSAAAGAASTVIRSDGTIAAFDATSPTTQAFGDSAVVGSAAFAARRDHKHGMPATPTTGQHILLADGHSTPFSFTDLLQMDDGSDFLWSDPE